MKKCMHKIENMPLQLSSIYSCPWQMSQSVFFPVKPSVQLYSDRKQRACQKLGNGQGVGKCPSPGQCKICKCPTPGTDNAGKCPSVAWGEGGGGLGAGGIDWCVTCEHKLACGWLAASKKIRSQSFSQRRIFYPTIAWNTLSWDLSPWFMKNIIS